MLRETGFFGRYKEAAYALFRFFFGLLFFFHGAQKLFGAFGGTQANNPLMWVGGFVEFVAGLAIAVGLFTSIAAFLAAGQMLVAYLMFHQPNALLPIQNRGELALLYMFGFLVIMTRGGGCWSVDSIKKGREMGAESS